MLTTCENTNTYKCQSISTHSLFINLSAYLCKERSIKWVKRKPMYFAFKILDSQGRSNYRGRQDFCFTRTSCFSSPTDTNEDVWSPWAQEPSRYVSSSSQQMKTLFPSPGVANSPAAGSVPQRPHCHELGSLVTRHSMQCTVAREMDIPMIHCACHHISA